MCGSLDGQVKRLDLGILWAFLACHIVMIIVSVFVHSPTFDELGHLPSGYVNWFGQMDAYRVNPPLVRMIAAQPLIWLNPDLRFLSPVATGTTRSEVSLALEFLVSFKFDAIPYFFYGRLMLLPFSIVGLFVCYLWAKDLYGHRAGLVAAGFWAFSPNMIAHGSLLTPDMAATAMGLLFWYSVWKMTCGPIGWFQSAGTGLLMSVTILTKFSWLPLLLLYPLVMFAVAVTTRQSRWIMIKVFLTLCVCLLLINMFYGFGGSLQSLSKYFFVSSRFQQLAQVEILKDLPIPFPAELVLGLDRQQFDFEAGFWSYFCGEWRQRGWWQYYLVGLWFKTPIGTLSAFLLSLGYCLFRVLDRWRNGIRGSPSIVTLVTLALPALFFLALVSAQTGFSHHLRYILPIYPFMYIFSSQVVKVFNYGKCTGKAAIIVVCLTIVGCCSNFPHSLSYFNCLAGGSANGCRYFSNSNVDWGQDGFFLLHWLKHHPEISVNGYDLFYPAELFVENAKPIPEIPPEGVYIVSANKLIRRIEGPSCFASLKPVDRIGYSMFVYRVGPSQFSESAGTY